MPAIPPVTDAPDVHEIQRLPHPDDTVHDGSAWASVPSSFPWDPNILALDGGGIRGYSSLLILEEIMLRVAEWERRLRPDRAADFLDPGELLPCHYFDYMYGTSTGGLIATMLGRLRMSVPQCLEIYRSVGETLFGKQRSRVPLTTKYHHKPLQEAVRRIVRAHCKQHLAPGECDGEDWHPWDAAVANAAGVDFDRHICQSICLTAVHNGRIDEAHLLRTYNHRYESIPNWITPYNEGADRLRVWQVTRATSAAPFYFDLLEAELDDQRWGFKDGGIRENNPAGAAWSEFVSRHGEARDPSLLLSIGTGRSDQSKDGFASAWPGPFGSSFLVRKAAEKFAVFKNVLIKYTDGEDKHKDMRYLARGEHRWYKRLNVTHGLEGMPLDEWRRGPWRDPATGVLLPAAPGGHTLSAMTAATRAYLDRGLDRAVDTYAPPRVMVAQVAERLVRQRLARERARDAGVDARRWDTYNGHYLTGVYDPRPDRPLRHDLADDPGGSSATPSSARGSDAADGDGPRRGSLGWPG